MFDINQELKKLPNKPGVYIMKDSYDNILYIGKASVLKNRVNQYFRASSNLSPRISNMVSKISSFEYIVTKSEMEALVLECNLIKLHKPKFNVLLKDDKAYPSIKVTVDEKFPRVFITRKILKDGAKYFGPYTDANAVKYTLAILKKIFPIRTCDKELEGSAAGKRPCLNYHINQCIAPCSGEVSPESYKKMIDEICEFLSGNQEKVIDRLKEDMEKTSEAMEFEKAAILRDKIGSAQKLLEKQKAAEPGYSDTDIDIIGLAKGTGDVCLQIFFVRTGKLIGREKFMFKNTGDIEEAEIITAFIKQFYDETRHVPAQILIGVPIQEQKIIEKWLSEKRKSKVEIKIPQKGDKMNLLEIAQRNAEIELQRQGLGYQTALFQLKQIMKLETMVKRIEAFDISNLSGKFMVGSMVVFDGKLDRHEYKRYRIKTVAGQNDVGCITEIISRRFRRTIKKETDSKASNEKFGRLPDVLLVDGGKLQVLAALKAEEAFNINIPIAGMVKNKQHKTKGLILQDGSEIDLKKYPQVLKLISEIQDEVHRFAVEYHRKVRKKESMTSVLDKIKGIGNARKIQLLKYFGSVEEVKKASIEELQKVKGMNSKAAKAVYEFFH